MKNILLICFEYVLKVLKFFMNPFDFVYKVKKPEIVIRKDEESFKYIDLLSREKMIEHLSEEVRYKNQLNNEILTIIKTFAVTIFVAIGAFLGGILGVIATADSSVSATFVYSTWTLLFCFVVGIVSSMAEWTFEYNRVLQLQMYAEAGTTLYIKGDEEQAKHFINLSHDDLSRLPMRYQLLAAFLPAIRNLALLAGFVAIVTITISILLNTPKV